MPKFWEPRKQNLGTAIVIVNGEGKKYRNIPLSDEGRNKANAFFKRKFPAATHVNWYNKDETFYKQDRFT